LSFGFVCAVGLFEQFCDLLFEEIVLSFELVDFHLIASIIIKIVGFFLIALFKMGVELGQEQQRGSIRPD
jgi:hypothetical protein